MQIVIYALYACIMCGIQRPHDRHNARLDCAWTAPGLRLVPGGPLSPNYISIYALYALLESPHDRHTRPLDCAWTAPGPGGTPFP